jgi:hypothetical protein
MSIFATIKKHKLSWKATPVVLVEETHYLNVGDGYRLNVGNGYTLVVQSGSTQSGNAWSNIRKSHMI